MNMTPMARAIAISVFAGLAGASAPSLAADPPTSREEMQRALNAEVMASKFDPGDVQKAQDYAEQAKKQNIPPPTRPPSYWVPGWNCGNLIGYAGYNYGDYRGCVYHHYYYGRYWR